MWKSTFSADHKKKLSPRITPGGLLLEVRFIVHKAWYNVFKS